MSRKLIFPYFVSLQCVMTMAMTVMICRYSEDSGVTGDENDEDAGCSGDGHDKGLW